MVGNSTKKVDFNLDFLHY